MRSSSPRSDLDLERGVPTTAADVDALRRIRQARLLSTEDYLRALARMQAAPREGLGPRARLRGGEPFRLA